MAWAVLLLGAMLLVGALAGPRPASASGLLIGCPDGPNTSVGAIHGVVITGTPEGGNLTVLTWLPWSDPVLPDVQDALNGPPEGRNLDVDSDGVPDLRWNLQFTADLSTTNLAPLWARLGGTLPVQGSPESADAPWLGIRVTFDRLADDPSVVPFEISGITAFDINTPVDPNDPDGPQTVKPTRVELGYDSRTPAAQAPTNATFDIVFQDAPVAQPDVGYLGARIATQYRQGNNPGAPLVAPGTEPAVATKLKVGTLTEVDQSLDLSIGWDRAPAEIAFVDATACGAADPEQTLAWDYRIEQPGQPPAGVAPTNAAVDLVTGKGLGVDGKPEMGLHGEVTAVPRGDDAAPDRDQRRAASQQASSTRPELPTVEPDTRRGDRRAARQPHLRHSGRSRHSPVAVRWGDRAATCHQPRSRH